MVNKRSGVCTSLRKLTPHFEALLSSKKFQVCFPAEEDDDADDLPTVTPAECTQIMEKITMIMQQQIQTLMRKIQAQGAQIPQQMLQSYLIEHFETQLKEVQSVVFREFGKDEDEVEHKAVAGDKKAAADDGFVVDDGVWRRSASPFPLGVTTFAAARHLVPAALPFLAPGEWSLAHDAYFGG